MIDELMANVIVNLSNNEMFRSDMRSRIGKAVDTSEFESQIEQINKQIRNKNKTLKRKDSRKGINSNISQRPPIVFVKCAA